MSGVRLEAKVHIVTGAVITSYSIHYTKLYDACSSFDHYENYKERGDHFRNLVHKYTAMEAGVEMLNSPWVASRKDNRKLNAHNWGLDAGW